MSVNYVESARRHIGDAHILMQAGRRANGGQLLGFCVECGLKALLLASGVPADPDGGIPAGHQLRSHMPVVYDRLFLFGHLIPDSARLTHYLAMLPTIGKFANWLVDHRYFKESAIPLASLPDWDLAALEVSEMLDQAILDGVL